MRTPPHIASIKYKNYIKPKLQLLLEFLRLDIPFSKAQGDSLFWLDDTNREHIVYDFLGGYGSTILGHNNPQLLDELQNCIKENEPVHAQLSVRSYAADLAELINKNLLQKSNHKSEYYVHLCNTGTEAIEAAIKHALMEWQSKKEYALLSLKTLFVRSQNLNLETYELLKNKIETISPVFIALSGAFHGKTSGSLSLTHNQTYSSMFHKNSLDVEFIDLDADLQIIKNCFSKLHIQLTQDISFSQIVGVIIEPVQGEAGVRITSTSVVQALSELTLQNNIPLIVDEIQSGLYRTGTFLALDKFKIEPDYITLGKSLGGGLVKISALLVKKSRYQPDFGIIHTSTFAEDNWSSRVAIKTLQCLSADLMIESKAKNFEEKIKSQLKKMDSKYPGVIQEIRGQGFLIGIEFNFEKIFSTSATIEFLAKNGLITYLLCSYLIHKHSIRLAPTLSQSNTLRIEPNCDISDTAVQKLLTGLEHLVEILWHGNYQELLNIIVPNSPIENIAPVQRFKSKNHLREITFLLHYISDLSVVDFEPLAKHWPVELIKKLTTEIGPELKSFAAFEQEIEDQFGNKILLKLRGIPVTSQFFEDSLKANDRRAYLKVYEAASSAKAEKSKYIGLGQYTSIVSDNGLMLNDLGIPVTTGNSLTVGMTYRAFIKMAEKKNKKTKDLRIGIVGIAGNICSVLAQLIADDVKELVVVHRQSISKSAKFRKTVELIIENSSITSDRIFATDNLSELYTCDGILMGTNSTLTFLKSEHLMKEAFVIDISVPTNIDPQVAADRPDVECIQGGLVKLPLEQKIIFDGLKTPDGEIYACMAETITAGLLNIDYSLSTGRLTKENILKVLKMADQVGMTLGSFKQIKAF